VRFIVNLPQEELQSVERIIFQIEEGHWYYEDFIRPLDPTLPSINLKYFCALIFQQCPILSGFSNFHTVAYAEFSAYKTRVPVRGAILLNHEMDHAVLVKGWKSSAKWSFPRGKINKDERDLDCAIREVFEETGYDVRAAGLVNDEETTKYIDVTLREQQMRLYIFRGVPMDTYFEPQTRKEISVSTPPGPLSHVCLPWQHLLTETRKSIGTESPIYQEESQGNRPCSKTPKRHPHSTWLPPSCFLSRYGY
jgi:mRNA-decapping enzyme subunit 2